MKIMLNTTDILFFFTFMSKKPEDSGKTMLAGWVIKIDES